MATHIFYQRILYSCGWSCVSQHLHNINKPFSTLVSSHSCFMYVEAGRPAFAQSYVGVYWSTSLMSLSLLLQQCSACLVRLTWIVFMMGGRWPYSWCLVGCCRQDLFNIARSILVCNCRLASPSAVSLASK